MKVYLLSIMGVKDILLRALLLKFIPMKYKFIINNITQAAWKYNLYDGF